VTTYQIRDWNEHFENATSRERKKCMWVPMPNKQSGLGLSRILAEKDGAALYGIWVLIVGACSRQLKPRSGWLTDTGRAPGGHHAGTPWTPADLALMFRRPDKEIERALAVLSSNAVGWLDATSEVSAEYPQGIREVSAECPRSTSLQKEEKEGTEGREEAPAEPSPLPPLSDPQLKISNRLCCEPFALSPAKCTELAIRYTGAEYRAVDIQASLSNCAEWLADNPERKSRTQRGMVQRVNSWIKADRDRPVGSRGKPEAVHVGTAGPVADAFDTYNDPRTGIYRGKGIDRCKAAGISWGPLPPDELIAIGKGGPLPGGAE